VPFPRGGGSGLNQLTGDVTAGPGTGSQAATLVGTAAVEAIIAANATVAGKAPLASPTFTGVPAAPTAAALTNTTQLATTAFVLANLGAPGIAVTPFAGTWWPNYAQSADVLTITPTVGQLHAYPIVVTATHTYVALGLFSVAPGTTGIMRVGIYADNGGTPVGGALVLDAGTIAIVINGNTKAISQSLAPGVYWLVTVSQQTGGIGPTFAGDVGSPNSPVFGSSNNHVGATGAGGFLSTSTAFGSGTLPGTFPAGAAGNAVSTLIQS